MAADSSPRGTTRYTVHCRACGAFTDCRPWEHDCPVYREEPPLAEVVPSFTVIPQRTPAQLAESLHRYRRAIRD